MRLRNKRVLIFVSLAAILLILGIVKIVSDIVYVPVVIMYHSVARPNTALSTSGGKLNVLPEAFARQMKFLHDQNYNVISLDDFIDRIKSGKRIPHKTLTITFDDGFKNIFVEAYPVLKKYNFPATVFVVTDSIGKDKFLSWQDIAVMQRNNITIGSHTISHRFLTEISSDDVHRELAGSKKILEEKTGTKIKFLSYPAGRFNEQIKNA
ncbi:MAG: polysaccharide deacetylase family protein, partial [Candidatus Omnitrophota bacterium]